MVIHCLSNTPIRQIQTISNCPDDSVGVLFRAGFAAAFGSGMA